MRIFLRILSYCIILAGTVLFSISCTPPDESGVNSEKWTSTDPLVVNQRVREQKLMRGNLIPNPSFELGKVKTIDSLTRQIKIDSWEIIGDKVEWISPNADSVLINPGEVHSGFHSICVRRVQADETEDFGQGVLSDYIKVIPGNYIFSLFLNLQDIKNPKSRLGTKIYDAVDIRVLYYDRNKLQIKGEQYSPHFNTTIDNSFKGLSFANFEQIDSTGWLHIIGRSQLFPFPDGDLPDDTKFVRMFIGLKGTGTLMADDVCYEYSRSNFTVLERLSKYFDTTFAKSELIFPQPRELDILESRIYYKPKSANAFPIIYIPRDADEITKSAASRLEKEIRNRLVQIGNVDSANIPKLIRHPSKEELINSFLIFSIGKTDLLIKNSADLPLNEIADKDQGYFIYSSDALSNTIFIYGNTPVSNYYAVQSTLQLFDSKRLIFHNAKVIDYPSGESRSILFENYSEYTHEFLTTSNETRFNSVYLSATSGQLRKILSNNSANEIYSKYLYVNLKGSNLCSYTAENNLQMISDEINSYANKIKGVAILNCSPMANGISMQTLMSNYYRAYNCTSGFENADELLINKAHMLGLNIEILPGCVNNINCKILCRNNSDRSAGSKKITYLWTGYSLQSWRIDEADLLAIEDRLGATPCFLDFTMYPNDRKLDYFANDTVFPYKLLTGCLFEAYINDIVPEIYDRVKKTILVSNVSNVFDKIRLQTASDFFWNPENYDPDLSLYKALVSTFGVDDTYELLKFNDLYFRIKSELILARNQKNTHKNLRKANSLLKEVHEVEVNLSLTNSELKNELKALILELEEMKAIFNKNANIN